MWDQFLAENKLLFVRNQFLIFHLFAASKENENRLKGFNLGLIFTLKFEEFRPHRGRRRRRRHLEVAKSFHTQIVKLIFQKSVEK